MLQDVLSSMCSCTDAHGGQAATACLLPRNAEKTRAHKGVSKHVPVLSLFECIFGCHCDASMLLTERRPKKNKKKLCSKHILAERMLKVRIQSVLHLQINNHTKQQP
jgi:hypothetical protein